MDPDEDPMPNSLLPVYLSQSKIEFSVNGDRLMPYCCILLNAILHPPQPTMPIRAPTPTRKGKSKQMKSVDFVSVGSHPPEQPSWPTTPITHPRPKQKVAPRHTEPLSPSSKPRPSKRAKFTSPPVDPPDMESIIQEDLPKKASNSKDTCGRGRQGHTEVGMQQKTRSQTKGRVTCSGGQK